MVIIYFINLDGVEVCKFGKCLLGLLDLIFVFEGFIIVMGFNGVGKFILFKMLYGMECVRGGICICVVFENEVLIW